MELAKLLPLHFFILCKNCKFFFKTLATPSEIKEDSYSTRSWIEMIQRVNCRVTDVTFGSGFGEDSKSQVHKPKTESRKLEKEEWSSKTGCQL